MNKQMNSLLYSLLHFLTGQMWQSGLVVHDAPGMCLATAGAATPAAAADTARRLLAAWNACEGIPTFSAAVSVERVETALDFTPDDENSAPDFTDDGEEEYYAACCAKNGEENDAAICAECGHGVAFGSGRFVNRAPIFDSYDARCEMGYSYPAMKASSVPSEWHGAVPFGSDDDATSGEVLERQRASQ